MFLNFLLDYCKLFFNIIKIISSFFTHDKREAIGEDENKINFISSHIF